MYLSKLGIITQTVINIEVLANHTVQNCPLAIDLSVLQVGVLDGRVVVRHKDFLEELDGKGALSHTTVTHHHQLVGGEVVARHSAGRHSNS